MRLSHGELIQMEAAAKNRADHLLLEEEKRKQSELTFGELTENLAWIKIIYNGEVIYDDYDGEETVESVRRIEEAYKDKIVYRMDVRIVDWHHCILTIRGE